MPELRLGQDEGWGRGGVKHLEIENERILCGRPNVADKGVGGMREVLRGWVSRPSLGRWRSRLRGKMNSVVHTLGSEGWGKVAQNGNVDTQMWVPRRGQGSQGDRTRGSLEGGCLGSNPAPGNLQTADRSGFLVRRT